MIVASSVAAVKSHSTGRLWVAIGNWDGVHLGHRSIVADLVSGARAAGAQSLVMGFYPHPMAVLRPEVAPLQVQSLSERACDLAEAGVDFHLVLPFSAEFSALSPADFAGDVLIHGLQAQQVMVGFNFTFGKGGRGTAQMLAEMLRPQGVAVRVFAPVRVSGETVSSTAVRYFLASGDVERAAELLGHPYRLIGPVVSGDRRGRELGYPTANVAVFPGRQLPAPGVYAVRVTVLDVDDLGCPDAPPVWPLGEPDDVCWVPDRLTGPSFGGMLNLGYRPTFQGRELRCEVNLFDFAGDLYQRRLRVEFASWLRPEQTFTGLAALQEQLARDAEAARVRLRAFDPLLGV